eukprot:g3865.t1
MAQKPQRQKQKPKQRQNSYIRAIGKMEKIKLETFCFEDDFCAMENVVAVDFAVIEPSKENVQPLKGGRDALKLSKTINLSKHPEKEEAILAKQREEHESKIKFYTGDDPLSPWLNYIMWTRTSHTTVGAQTHHLQLLEKCTREFKDNNKYRNDIRYLKVWIMYADAVPDPIEIFAFLKSNRIGVTHALFYEAWAIALEDQGKTSKADKVLEYGIRKEAQPLNRLRQAYERFQRRAVRRIQKQQAETETKATNNIGVMDHTTRQFGNQIEDVRRGGARSQQQQQGVRRQGLGVGLGGANRNANSNVNNRMHGPAAPGRANRCVEPYRRPATSTMSQMLVNPSNNFTVFQDDTALPAEDPLLVDTMDHVEDRPADTDKNGNYCEQDTKNIEGAFAWNTLAPTEAKNKENNLKPTTWNDPLRYMIEDQDHVVRGVMAQLPSKLKADTRTSLRAAAGEIFVEEEFIARERDGPSLHDLAGPRRAGLVLTQQDQSSAQSTLSENPLQNMAR